jgi:fibronectin type 3 domain-containing protein
LSAGQILSPGQNGTLNVTFSPAAGGSVTGSLVVMSSASNSPATIALSGTGLQAVPHSVDLSWMASTSVVAGYNVYRGVQSGGPYSKLNSTPVALTNDIDSTVQAGQTYFYVITAVDSNNVESAYSNEVSAVIPIP